MTWVFVTFAVALAAVLGILVLILFSGGAPKVLRLVATMLAVGLFFGGYYAVDALRGFPSDAALPDRFQLHWARIVEPDKASGAEGSIFLWIEALDDQNLATGLPRAYRVVYTDDLARMVEAAMDRVKEGDPVAGEFTQEEEGQDAAERLAAELEDSGEPGEDRLGDRAIRFESGDIRFTDMPAVELLDKQETR